MDGVLAYRARHGGAARQNRPVSTPRPDATPEAAPTPPPTALPPGRRRPNRAGDERRRRLLDVAAQQFARHGYERTSIAQVARAAGISDAGLLHHFPSKRALYAAILERRSTVFAGALGRPTTLDGLVEGLLAGVEAQLAAPDVVRLQAVLGGEMLVDDHVLRDEYLDGQRRGLDELAETIAALVRAGEVDASVDPATLAVVILGTLKGVRGEWALLPDRVDLRAVTAEALDRIRASVRPAAGA